LPFGSVAMRCLVLPSSFLSFCAPAALHLSLVLVFVLPIRPLSRRSPWYNAVAPFSAKSCQDLPAAMWSFPIHQSAVHPHPSWHQSWPSSFGWPSFISPHGSCVLASSSLAVVDGILELSMVACGLCLASYGPTDQHPLRRLLLPLQSTSGWFSSASPEALCWWPSPSSLFSVGVRGGQGRAIIPDHFSSLSRSRDLSYCVVHDISEQCGVCGKLAGIDLCYDVRTFHAPFCRGGVVCLVLISFSHRPAIALRTPDSSVPPPSSVAHPFSTDAARGSMWRRRSLSWSCPCFSGDHLLSLSFLTKSTRFTLLAPFGGSFDTIERRHLLPFTGDFSTCVPSGARHLSISCLRTFSQYPPLFLPISSSFPPNILLFSSQYPPAPVFVSFLGDFSRFWPPLYPRV